MLRVNLFFFGLQGMIRYRYAVNKLRCGSRGSRDEGTEPHVRFRSINLRIRETR